MTLPDLQEGEHPIVALYMIPCDLTDEGTAIPRPSEDDQPAFVCEICWAPLHSIDGPCPGPKIPDNIAGLQTGVE